MPKVEIKCLSIRQPFVDQILAGRKRIENRQWLTRYRGTLYLHSSRFEEKPSPAKLVSRGVMPDLIQPTIDMWEKPAGDGVIQAIAGCVDLVEIMTADELTILHRTAVGRTYLAWSDAGSLYPSEREGFLDRFRHVHQLVADMTEREVELHCHGWFCWLLANPRALEEPIYTGGKLNLWKFEVNSRRLIFKEPLPKRKRRK